MGNPNNRGQPKFVSKVKQIEMEKLAKEKELADKKEAADKLWAEEKQKREINKKLEMKAAQEKKAAENKATEENAKKIASTMNFEDIQKHYALFLQQIGDTKQLVINLNFIADPPTDMLAVIKILPEYSPAITIVQINLLAPNHHGSRKVYQQRVQNMNQLMEQLNSFPITVLNISVNVDDHYNFQQLKLAAAVNGLVFQDWTVEYQVWGSKILFPIKRHSSYYKRLRGVYKTEFGGSM
ncbi:hypothetical protein EYC80_003754 [Monilinia laxa]|uniref:Uncharacterized protein n=1 Tax=Monilinia laxa TaxID=61186 RepID=A0A5N6KKP3_MONLA|nr:hypothetical protein EYC80_003754 [Monilinia laxa]